MRFLSCRPNLFRASQLISLSTENDHELSHILDSIANISISQTNDEVVAVAVQVGKTDTRLIVASNDTLPDSTITHLKGIWIILKQLSKDYQCVPGSSSSIRLPRTKDLTEDAQMRVIKLQRKILRFAHLRLRRRVSKNYSNVISLDDDIAEKLGLEVIITQLKVLKRALDKSALSSKSWGYIWNALVHISNQLDQYSKTIKDFDNTPLVPFNLSRYLTKIVSIVTDTTFLKQAAHTPSLRALLLRDFQIINVKGSGGVPSNLPKSRAAWAQLVQDTLGWYNMAVKEYGGVKFAMNETEVQQDVVKMCKKPLRKATFVHCELKIVSYMLQSSEQGFLNYIGVSKLSCEGCVQFIRAVECVLGERFRVKDNPGTFYYPWAFPDIPNASSVAEQMRNTVSFFFGQTYKGFRPENKRYLSDSESTLADDLIEDEEEASRVGVHFHLLHLNQVKRARSIAKRAKRSV